MFGINEEDQRKWMDQNRGAVQKHVDGPLLAYGACFRTDSDGKAGGLPRDFVVTVTDDRIQAFRYRARGQSLKLGDEVAVWDRDTIVASAEETQMTKRVTLASPGDEERIVFDMPKASISDELIAALGAAVAI